VRERAIELVQNRPSGTDGRDLLREYLHSRILGAMQEAGVMASLAFRGGTARRFIYRQPRFSEGLHFTLERDDDGFDLTTLVERMRCRLEREGYEVTVRLSEAGTVARASLGFPGILATVGLPSHDDEPFEVLLDVDRRPPAGATLDVTLVNRSGPLRIQHHDLPSLFAGKIASFLTRPAARGRDLYDLMWYLMWKPVIEPNLALLGSTLRQALPQVTDAVVADWRRALRERMAEVDWAEARSDAAPFIEQQRELELLDAPTFEHLLKGAAAR